jgi:hypothetical protein
VKWTELLALLDSFVGIAAVTANQKIPDAHTRTQVVAALHALYVVVQGVNDQFRKAFDDAKNGHDYTPSPPEPASIPAFPEMTGDFSSDLVDQGWQVVENLIKIGIARVESQSVWFMALNGLLEKAKEIVQQLKEVAKA